MNREISESTLTDEPLPYDDGDRQGEPNVSDQPFAAEAPRRKNWRLALGVVFVVALIVFAIIFGAKVLRSYRDAWTAERAAKDKAALAKAEAGRKGRQFGDLIADAPTPSPMPPPAAPPRNDLPLPAGVPPKPVSSPPTPAAKPVPPPMLEWGPSGAAGSGANSLPVPGSPAAVAAAAAAASAAAGQGGPAGGPGMTVQAQAQSQHAGKPATSTAQASAALLGNRSYLLARGSWIPCILETQLVSTIAGNTSCVIPEDVYSDDGKVLLIEKGSRSQGSFGNTLKVGENRIAVTWSRIKTARGVVIDVESPAADGVGTTGAGGYVDNHWLERVGGAILLSFIEDGLALAVAESQNRGQTSGVGEVGANRSSTNVFLPNNSIGATRQLSEKILDSTINIAPTLYKNRGDRIMIFVNRDLWFDSTYRLVKAQ